MTIVFAPIRARRNVAGPDLCVRVRRNKAGVSLDLTLSAEAQSKVRYVDGDRVIARFDEDNKSWELERISPDRIEDGYKISVRQCSRRASASGRHFAWFRVGCRDASHATQVLGARDRAEYEFLETAGNKTTFIERE